MTPLGSAVVPEVYSSAARSLSAGTTRWKPPGPAAKIASRSAARAGAVGRYCCGLCSAAADVITERDVQAGDRLGCDWKMFRIAEQQGSPAVEQQFLDLIGMESRIQRNRRSAGCDNPQIGRHPPRMIGRRIATRASRGTALRATATLSAICVSSAKLTRSTVCCR